MNLPGFETKELALKYIEDHKLKDCRVYHINHLKKYYIKQGAPYETVPKKSRYFKNGISKKSYLKTAKELCYPEEVIEQLLNATTENEALRVLTDARHKY